MKIPILSNDDWSAESGKRWTFLKRIGRNSRFKTPVWVDVIVEPFGRTAVAPTAVLETSVKQDASDILKKFPFAPESVTAETSGGGDGRGELLVSDD